jgi:putative flavoprotein involved in K+ transport
MIEAVVVGAGQASWAGYAEAFSRPVRTGTPVTLVRAAEDSGGFAVEKPWQVLRSARVIVATGRFQRPHVPECAPDLDASIGQLHSDAERYPQDFPGGGVRVVGAGDSGVVQIAQELAGTGRLTSVPGLGFLELPRMHARGSALFDWVGRDAEYLVQRLGSPTSYPTSREELAL